VKEKNWCTISANVHNAGFKMIVTRYIEIRTKGNTDVIDLTGKCRDMLSESRLRDGIMTVFCPGSTGGVTALEYEPNLVRDLKSAMEIFAPSDKRYEHFKTWNDDNGSAHIRSALMGPSMSVPFVKGEMTLGTWQQIVFCDFDTRPRDRKLTVQIMGE